MRGYAQALGYNFEDVLADKRLYQRLYHQLHRSVMSFEKEGLVRVSKHEGVLWVEPMVDLIDRLTKQNSNICQTVNQVSYRRMHDDRFEAFMLLSSKKRLEFDDWSELLICLNDYINDVSKRVLVFKHVDEPRFLLLRYNHRFLKRMIKRKLKEYDMVWSNASAKYDEGVFLTLTLNPETYSNLIDASRRISLAFNRFMSFLSRRFGFRPTYVWVFEPQNSGNPHLHVVIFGVGRIGDHFELTKFLVKHGFGFIHFEYKIKKDKNGNWVWANRRFKPRNCKTSNVKEYLKKYLIKTLRVQEFKPDLRVEDMKIGFYFASGKRFFSCSRVLMVKSSKNERSGLWVYVGCFHYLEIPNFVYEWLMANGLYLSYDDKVGSWVLEGG